MLIIFFYSLLVRQWHHFRCYSSDDCFLLEHRLLFLGDLSYCWAHVHLFCFNLLLSFSWPLAILEHRPIHLRLNWLFSPILQEQLFIISTSFLHWRHGRFRCSNFYFYVLLYCFQYLFMLISFLELFILFLLFFILF